MREKMEYKYCENQNFEDFSSGRVIYGGEGMPNFPVRLLNEIFGRAAAYSDKKECLKIYDPCCGGGYSLTVLGFCHSDTISQIYGSDIDDRMVNQARRNTHLLTNAGMNNRRLELQNMLSLYQKSSHADALKSLEKIQNMLQKEINAEIFQADSTKALPCIKPDIIITDVPYGNLVTWNGEETSPLSSMLRQLAAISHKGTILALCTDKKQKFTNDLWERLESQSIGKRKFEICRKL